MAIKSSMPVGNIENAQAYSPLSTSFSNSAVPRMPPTKLMRLLVRGSSMPKIGDRARAFAAASRRAIPGIGPLSAASLYAERQRVPFALPDKGRVRVCARARPCRPGQWQKPRREFPATAPASSRSNPSTRGCKAKSASGCAEKSRREIVRSAPRPCAIEKPAPPPRCDDGRRRCTETESVANCVSMNLISSASGDRPGRVPHAVPGREINRPAFRRQFSSR